jgi:hypothetical protein
MDLLVLECQVLISLEIYIAQDVVEVSAVDLEAKTLV